jgi:hypothetical protein
LYFGLYIAAGIATFAGCLATLVTKRKQLNRQHLLATEKQAIVHTDIYSVPCEIDLTMKRIGVVEREQRLTGSTNYTDEKYIL